jgi:bifunctional non-homologous end joining protein LigD
MALSVTPRQQQTNIEVEHSFQLRQAQAPWWGVLARLIEAHRGPEFALKYEPMTASATATGHKTTRRPLGPAHLPGARKRRAAELSPALCTLVTDAPEGEAWIHEIKLDGYRLLCSKNGARVRLTTRSGLDWTSRFPAIEAAMHELPVDEIVLDGEAVLFDEQGRTSFQRMVDAIRKAPAAIVLQAFDLLRVDGWDVRGAPLVDRKRLLSEVVGQRPTKAITVADHVVGNGPRVFHEACKSGVEGIVSKRGDGAYPVGRTKEWLKIRCGKRQELVVVGFTDPKGSRAGIGALLLGVYDDGKLRYAGKVGTGFSTRTLEELRERLEPLGVDRPPVVGAPRVRGQHWTRPELVAEIGFTEWTRDGRVRHPTFLGLREDKPARKAVRERPVETSRR